MQRSMALISGIAGGIGAVATTYLFNPLAQCASISNALSTINANQSAINFAVASYSTQFQIDFVNFFNQHYPHGTDFHNLLMDFDGYSRASQIGWQVSEQAFEAFKSFVINACQESVATLPIARNAAIGVAAGVSLALLAKHTFFNSSEVRDDHPQPAEVQNPPPPPVEIRDNRSAVQQARLFQVKSLDSRHVSNHRIQQGLNR